MSNEYLLKALDNDANASIMKLNSTTIKTEKFNIIRELGLNMKEIKTIMKKLEGYRLIDELHDIKCGSYVRWINILDTTTEVKLTNGGIILDVKIYDNGCHIICKNKFNNIMQIKLDENIIFQRISDQEQILLSALDYLQDG